jgi:hypothetical protein
MKEVNDQDQGKLGALKMEVDLLEKQSTKFTEVQQTQDMTHDEAKQQLVEQKSAVELPKEEKIKVALDCEMWFRSDLNRSHTRALLQSATSYFTMWHWPLCHLWGCVNSSSILTLS